MRRRPGIPDSSHALISLDVAGLCLALSDWSAELRILARPNEEGVAYEHDNECRR
jgi:hypothetical protein